MGNISICSNITVIPELTVYTLLPPAPIIKEANEVQVSVPKYEYKK